VIVRVVALHAVVAFEVADLDEQGGQAREAAASVTGRS
jgi:hypothetical protein